MAATTLPSAKRETNPSPESEPPDNDSAQMGGVYVMAATTLSSAKMETSPSPESEYPGHKITENDLSTNFYNSKDVNTVKKLVDDCLSSELSSSLRPHDVVSALGPMDKKNEMNIFVHDYMQKIAYLQYSIKDVRCRFFVFQEALKRQSDQFEHLKVVRGIGSAYACLAEVVRRKETKKIYMGKAENLLQRGMLKLGGMMSF
ncbi:hypothetical protein ACS0TY_015460 [Phlomoides rotata]